MQRYQEQLPFDNPKFSEAKFSKFVAALQLFCPKNMRAKGGEKRKISSFSKFFVLVLMVVSCARRAFFATRGLQNKLTNTIHEFQ